MESTRNLIIMRPT